MLIGSLEWFREESKSDYNKWLNEMIENRRVHFLNWFAPNKLLEMDKSTLLIRVFSPKETSMIRMLMYDSDCRWFGAPGTYAYAGVLYYDQSRSTWKYKNGQSPVFVSREKAEELAVYLRKQLLYCVRCIKDIGVFHSVDDYQKLQSKLSSVFFSQYAWTLKYYQMLFPEYFPGMYTDYTINRAIQILGLPDHENKLLNAGEISLFIRRCNINNIVFGNIYGTQWGWERDYPTCEAALNNLRLSYYPVKELDLSMYRTPQSQDGSYSIVGSAQLTEADEKNRKASNTTNNHNSTKLLETNHDSLQTNNNMSLRAYQKQFHVGCKVEYTGIGFGTVVKNKGTLFVVDFDKQGKKTLNIESCYQFNLLKIQ